mgnify:FL=1
MENVAFATVGDVMDLTDENRILVREGLKRIHTTMNPGMRALILQNKLEPEQISSYHFGFVLGPCINASGRLETAKIALNLFLQEDVKKASEIAAELVDLNAQRKDMTAEGVELAMQQVKREIRVKKSWLSICRMCMKVLQESLQEESGRRVINRLCADKE